MSEIVRRVSEAIADELRKRGMHPLDPTYLGVAAIKAMREPTEAMVKEAENCDDPGSSIFGDPFVACSHDEAWRVMIDKALSE